MYILIGDIGNTVTKICLCAKSNLKIEKIIYINSNIIYSEFNLKKILKKILNNKKINKLSLFSSVVPPFTRTSNKLNESIIPITANES